MKTQHTPTPWHLSEPPLKENFIYDEDGLLIADVNGFFKREAAENSANADFIVRACNAHDELVEALENLQHADGCYCEASFSSHAGSHPTHSIECQDAIKALAKARGES